MMEKIESGLSKEASAAIGRFIANFALLEKYIRETVIDFPGKSAWAGEIIVSQLSFSALMRCYGALIGEFTPPDGRHQRALQLLKEVQRINEHRNRIVHSTWFKAGHEEEDLKAQKTFVNRRTGMHTDGTLYSIKELNLLGEEIAILTSEAATIYCALVTIS